MNIPKLIPTNNLFLSYNYNKSQLNFHLTHFYFNRQSYHTIQKHSTQLRVFYCCYSLNFESKKNKIRIIKLFKHTKMASSKTVRKLEVLSPVPADIDIANAVEPLHIADIAADLNLSPHHYDLYGKYKAKVFSISFDFLFDVY